MPDESNTSETADPPGEPTHSRVPGSGLQGRIHGVCGVVLAGGKSRRYGRNKALERIDGATMIERTIRALQSVFHNVLLSTNTPDDFRFLGLPFIEDLVRELGPLGGVHAGLSAMPDEAGFFVACDMPFLNPALIRHMAGFAGSADAVVPRIGGYLQPLHALYRRTCLGPMERAIERGDQGIRSFYPDIRIHVVEEESIRTFEPELEAFININWPEELKDLQYRPGRRRL